MLGLSLCHNEAINVVYFLLYLPYFLECFSPSNCIRPFIVFTQQSGLNVYCVHPHIVFARCSKCCARVIVIRKDNSLSGKVSITEIETNEILVEDD